MHWLDEHWPLGYRIGRAILCRLDRHDPWCRGRTDHDRRTGRPRSTTARWEVVARWTMPDGQSWIVPLSEDRHYRSNWIAARWTAWHWTRRSRLERDSLPPYRWIIRRTT